MSFLDKALKDVAKFAGDAVNSVGKAAGDAGSFIGKAASDVGSTIGGAASDVGDFIGKTASDVGNAVSKTANDAWMTLDANGDGVVDITDIIILAFRAPGIRIDRTAFLTNEFRRTQPEEVVQDAVAYNPMHAGIPKAEIDRIANAVITYERNCVSGISAALSAPGGFAMAATIPADLIQFYGYMLRAAQKLMYLYGFPEIGASSDGIELDTGTINELTVCLGAMYGVAGASNALKVMAKALGNGVQKQLMKKALTKGTIYPIVKSVAKWFGVRMTKTAFTGFFSKAIPVIGGVLGGAITYASFGPCCTRLVGALQSTALSDPDYKEDDDVKTLYAELNDDDGE